MTEKNNDNYDPSEIIKETRDKLERPDMFAEIFCKAAKSQVIIKDCLSEIISNVLLADKGTNDHLKIVFKKIIDEDNTQKLSKIGSALLNALIFVLGIITTIVVTFLMNKLGMSS